MRVQLLAGQVPVSPTLEQAPTEKCGDPDLLSVTCGLELRTDAQRSTPCLVS